MMQRSKENFINGFPNKDNSILSPKMANKVSLDRCQEKKFGNSTNNAEPILNKFIIQSVGDGELDSLKFRPVSEKNKVRVVKNIGFENLPDQIYRRSLCGKFEFNLMVVGCSGLGKSTFVNNLFLAELYNKENLPPSKRVQKTVQISATTVFVKENSVSLKLTLIDTPGFGDSVDNSECWIPVEEYIKSKFNEFMKAQNRVNRTRIADSRVHACLYFIEPTGHGLKPLDVEFMKHIHDKVNVIPIIAKADSLTSQECEEFKKTIFHQIKSIGIRIYDFPEEVAAISLGISSVIKCHEANWKDISNKRKRQPFAVVGSNVIIDKCGVKVRGRSYPWGIVEVDNLEHNDFSALRTLLLSSHLQDLKDTTDLVLYENFRFKQMSNFAKDSQFGIIDGKDPMSQMDEERRGFEARIRKMEEDMRILFEQKVAEKTKKLEEFQMNIERTEREMVQQLEKEIKELEFKRNNFETTRLHWEEMNREFNFRVSMDTLDSKEKIKTKSRWLLK